MHSSGVPEIKGTSSGGMIAKHLVSLCSWPSTSILVQTLMPHEFGKGVGRLGIGLT